MPEPDPRSSPLRDDRLPLLALAALMVLAGAFIFWETRGQALYADELTIFSSYRDWQPGTLLRPEFEHLILTSVVAYQGLWEAFGAESLVPTRLLHVALAEASALLVFLLVRPRVGPWAALAPAALLLMLGRAHEITATPFGILVLIGIPFCLAMFLALERDDRRGDMAACALLAAGLASISVSLAFIAGAAVIIWMRGPARRWRSAWIVAGPTVAYGIWNLLAVDPGQGRIMLDNLTRLPGSLFELAAGGSGALTGLFRDPGLELAFTPDPGYALTVLFAVLISLRLQRGPSPSPRFWAYAATLLVFWVLVTLNAGELHPLDASRYQYVSVLLMCLIAAELLPPPRLRSGATAALGVAFALSLLANAVTLHQLAPTYRAIGNVDRAILTATEIAAPAADLSQPVFALAPSPATGDLIFPARDYLDAVREYGSPGFTEAELAATFETPRRAADEQMARLLGITTIPGGVNVSAPGCRTLRPDRDPAGFVSLATPPGTLTLRAGNEPAALSLRRFADGFGFELPGLAADVGGQLTIPPDLSSRRWSLSIRSADAVRVCGPAGQ